MASGLGARRRLFTPHESDAAMVAWSRLCRENASVRIMRGGRLISALLTHLDRVLTEQASSAFELLVKLVARTLHHLDTGLDEAITDMMGNG